MAISINLLSLQLRIKSAKEQTVLNNYRILLNHTPKGGYQLGSAGEGRWGDGGGSGVGGGRDSGGEICL